MLFYAATFALLALACDQPDRAPAQAPPSAVPSRRAAGGSQQQDQASPDGAFVVKVPIVGAEGRDFASYWTPRIEAAGGEVVFEDSLGFPARFNVYWGWDDQQRLWLYNTDDGLVWIYAAGPEGWARSAWERQDELIPPAEIAGRLRAP